MSKSSFRLKSTRKASRSTTTPMSSSGLKDAGINPAFSKGPRAGVSANPARSHELCYRSAGLCRRIEQPPARDGRFAGKQLRGAGEGPLLRYRPIAGKLHVSDTACACQRL